MGSLALEGRVGDGGEMVERLGGDEGMVGEMGEMVGFGREGRGFGEMVGRWGEMVGDGGDEGDERMGRWARLGEYINSN